jgi:hypothetical protein
VKGRIGFLGRAAIAFSLLTGLAAVAPAPAVAAVRVDMTSRVLAALAATTPDWDDDEYDWYQQTLVDISRYDTEPEVRTAAQAALAVGTMAAVKAFVDTGWAAARAKATQRKSKNRKQVQDWAKTGGAKVKEYANRALVGGDFAIGEFVAWGREAADLLDHPVADTQAEQDRIRGRVEQMVAFGGPSVVAEGMAALGSGDPAAISGFYRTGYAAAARTDFDNRETIRVAVEARNTALDQITAQAELAADAAAGRASILRANVEAMKLLDDSLVAMQFGVKASRRADQILEEDKAARKNGKKGRTADLQELLAEASGQAQRASVAATAADSTVAIAQTAAARLLKTGQARGVDWAKVTIAAGSAIQAAAASAETAQHAAEATLADSRALDADANAQLHAKNAAKWLAAAQKQAQIAKNLAAVAQEQQKIAEAAAARAAAQRKIAESAADRAADHAAKARTARIAAQAASANAVGKSKAALSARSDASAAADRENAAVSRAKAAGVELETATNRCFAAQDAYEKITAALEKARAEAVAAGKDADAATADISAAADRARAAYNAAQAWADKAAAAAATARAEAQKASVAAGQARTAAGKAGQAALTAVRASDKAGLVAQGAVNAAETAKLDAQRTQTEAGAAVEESTQAVFNADVADQAAGAAAGSAEVAVDRADTADYIAAQFAGVNADARRIMQVTSLAVTDSEERQAAARRRADEAEAAADRATAAAGKAVGDIKPAYDAAAQAVQSANAAAKAANAAHAAAKDAIVQARGANRAAVRATRSEHSAWNDAGIADGASRTANHAAAVANKAANDAEAMEKWAKGQTQKIHDFADALGSKLREIRDEKVRQDAIAAQKREFEENAEKGLLSFVRCNQQHIAADCQKVLDFIKDKGKEAIDAGWSYVLNSAKCKAGDQAACDAVMDSNLRMLKFNAQIYVGLWEAAKGLWAGIKMLGDCMTWVVVGTDDPDFQENCGKTVEGFKALPGMLKDHPLELIHISEWQDNPGKALGMTLFDVGTFFIPGVGEVGGALNKLVSGLGSLLPRGLARLAEGVGVIDKFVVPLAEGVGKLPGGVAKLVNITVKIEGSQAKILDGIAIIDGVAYKLEGGAVKLTGAVEDLAFGTVQLQGGIVKLDGQIARLDNTVVNVGKSKGSGPKPCGVVGNEACIGELPDGSWAGEEFNERITLAKPFNDEAKKALDAARQNEPDITTRVKQATPQVPGATSVGMEKRLKAPDSLKRKLVGEHEDHPDIPPAELVGDINDNVRYTWTFEFEDYVTGAEAGVRQLAREGFVYVEGWNGWATANKPYRGLNTTWQDPRSGQFFEVQFHTKDSFVMNRTEHPLYEKWRNPASTPEEKAAAREESFKLWGTVEMPENANLLTDSRIRELVATI